MATPSTTDDRGARIELYGLLSERVRLIKRETVPIEVQKSIEQAVLRPGVSPSRPQVWPFVVGWICFGITMAVVKNLIGKDLPGWLRILAGAVIVGFAAAVGTSIRFRRLRRKHTRRIIEAFLAHTRCPACGYDLSGLEQDGTADGCVVCPECGAAWRMSASNPAS